MEVKIVRGGQAQGGREGIHTFLGVSSHTTGSSSLVLGHYRMPPGAKSTPHRHLNCETASYILSGGVCFIFGDSFKKAQDAGPGDFAYVPAGAWHIVENLSATEWVDAIAARNAPEEMVEEWPAGRPLK